MKQFLHLVVLVIFAGIATAAVILAMAVYRTWNEMHMTLTVVMGSLACLSIPAVAVAVVLHHIFEDRREQRAERRSKAEGEHYQLLMKLAKQQADAQVAAQRVITEEHRSARVAASLPAPQQQLTTSQWHYADWTHEEDEDD